MNTLSVVFLGVIAAATLAQAVLVAVACIQLSRAGSRMGALADELERDWPPLRERLSTACDELTAFSQSARAVAVRTESAVSRVTSTAEHAGGFIRAVAGFPVTPVGRLAALFRAV